MTRSTPISRSSTASAAVRIPPPSWRSTLVASMIVSKAALLTRSPSNAPSRSTRWSVSAP
jgi:hypothetical protein